MAESFEKDDRKQHGSEKSLSPSASEGSLSSESTISMPPAPDGGYGWIIILSAFLTSLISDGLAFSCGVLYSELLVVFDESKSITSWIPSLFLGVPMIAGPLAGALATKYGCRKVLMFGGIVTSVGVFASAFANSVALLCFLFGILAGTGLSMGYVTSVVMVAFYFEKRRALATGLAVCGSGIGTFVFAPLFEYLIEEYTWRGALIILSGITLNLVVCGALLRPLEFTAAEEWQRNLEAFEKISRTMSKASLPENGRNSRRESQNNSSDEDSDIEEIWKQLSNSQVILPTFLTEQKKQIPDEIFEEISKNTGQASQILKDYFHNQGSSEINITENPVQDMLMVTSNDNIVCVKEVPKRRQKVHNKNKATHKIQQYFPIYRKDLFYRGNVMKFSNIHYRSTSCPELYRGSFDDLIDDEDFFCPLPKLLRLSKHMKKFFKTMFDLSIIKNPLFLLFAVSNFMLYFWYDVPYVFSVHYAQELGFSDEASYLLSIIGVVNTVGQIFYGYIGDKDINIPLLYGLSISASGLAIFFYPLFHNYIVLAFICGAYGFFISANYVLSTMLLVEFLGMDKLTNAYGLTMLIQGIGNMVGPPFAGFLYDTSGSYDNSFYCSGIFIILAGFLLTTSAIYKCIRRVCSSHDVRNRKPAECGNGEDVTRVKFLKKDIEIIV